MIGSVLIDIGLGHCTEAPAGSVQLAIFFTLDKNDTLDKRVETQYFSTT